MDLQYFLEMMDPKHRHGSNLRKYHEYWKAAESHNNFFYWLDYGAGKDVELPVCPREKLEREQVRYLSPEQRLNYLVKIDRTGRFRWAKNNELVWTNNTRYEDSEDGILPVRAPDHKREKPDSVSPTRPWSESSESSLDGSEGSSTESDRPVLSRRRLMFNRIKDKIFTNDDWWIFVRYLPVLIHTNERSRTHHFECILELRNGDRSNIPPSCAAGAYQLPG